MGERRSSRSVMLLFLGLLPALAIGAFLAVRDSRSAASPPPPTVARVAAPLLPATAIPTAIPPTATATEPLPTATVTAVVPSPTPALTTPTSTHTTTPIPAPTDPPPPTLPPTATTAPPATTAPLAAVASSPSPAPTRTPTRTATARPVVPPTATTRPAAIPPTATPFPATATPTATVIPLPPSLEPTPTLEPTVEPTPPRRPTATPTVPPARAWVEVGRWRGSDILYTANFTVQGPWRIRWQLSAATEPCQVMIVDGSANPPLLTGAAGATTGVFSLQAGGTYSLMLHNTIPYEIVVEDFR